MAWGTAGAAKNNAKAASVEGSVAESPKTTQSGRLGSPNTRNQNANIANEMESRGWTIEGGGGRLPEEYISPLSGGRKGGSYPDITATKDGRTLRVNTVDVTKKGNLTKREATNAARIRTQKPNDHLLTVPKKK